MPGLRTRIPYKELENLTHAELLEQVRLAITDEFHREVQLPPAHVDSPQELINANLRAAIGESNVKLAKAELKYAKEVKALEIRVRDLQKALRARPVPPEDALNEEMRIAAQRSKYDADSQKLQQEREEFEQTRQYLDAERLRKEVERLKGVIDKFTKDPLAVRALRLQSQQAVELQQCKERVQRMIHDATDTQSQFDRLKKQVQQDKFSARVAAR